MGPGAWVCPKTHGPYWSCPKCYQEGYFSFSCPHAPCVMVYAKHRPLKSWFYRPGHRWLRMPGLSWPFLTGNHGGCHGIRVIPLLLLGQLCHILSTEGILGTHLYSSPLCGCSGTALLTSPHPPLNYMFRDILMTHLFLVVTTYLLPLLGGNLLDKVGGLPSLGYTQTLLLLNTIPPLPFNYITLCHISPKPSTHSHSRTLEDLNLPSLTS